MIGNELLNYSLDIYKKKQIKKKRWKKNKLNMMLTLYRKITLTMNYIIMKKGSCAHLTYK